MHIGNAHKIFAVTSVDKRYAFFALALVLLACLPLFADFAGISWEMSQLAGLIACAMCIGLCGAPVRARDSTPPALLSLRLHTLLGWIALGAVMVHVLGLVFADRVVIDYLKPSMPVYMAAGALAALLLILLVWSAWSPLRRRLWGSHRGFQATHVIAGVLLIAATAVHVIATGRYAGNHGRWILVLGATVGATLMLLRHRRPSAGATNSTERGRRWVFGRHSAWVVAALGVTSVSLTGLLMSASGTTLREPLAERAQALPLDFPHTKHVQVNCLTCHHNFADGTGFENCIMCHKSTRTDLKVGVQARFHAFCFECHRHPEESSAAHGPVSGCTSCHRTSVGGEVR